LTSISRDEQLHLKTVELIRAAYDVVDGMRRGDLAALNDARPPTLRYHAQYGSIFWTAQLPAGSNSTLAIAGDTLLAWTGLSAQRQAAAGHRRLSPVGLREQSHSG
jgi:hypothetical protein